MGLSLESISLDEAAADAGRWFTFMGSRLLIGSTDSPKYRGALAKLAREHKIELDDSNPEFFGLMQEITCEALSQHVLKDWEGITIAGEERTYTSALGKHALLTSPPLRSFVDEQGGRVENYKAEVIEQAKKSSPGKSSGVGH